MPTPVHLAELAGRIDKYLAGQMTPEEVKQFKADLQVVLHGSHDDVYIGPGLADAVRKVLPDLAGKVQVR
jgi:hypothetical protein